MCTRGCGLCQPHTQAWFPMCYQPGYEVLCSSVVPEPSWFSSAGSYKEVTGATQVKQQIGQLVRTITEPHAKERLRCYLESTISQSLHQLHRNDQEMTVARSRTKTVIRLALSRTMLKARIENYHIATKPCCHIVTYRRLINVYWMLQPLGRQCGGCPSKGTQGSILMYNLQLMKPSKNLHISLKMTNCSDTQTKQIV